MQGRARPGAAFFGSGHFHFQPYDNRGWFQTCFAGTNNFAGTDKPSSDRPKDAHAGRATGAAGAIYRCSPRDTPSMTNGLFPVETTRQLNADEERNKTKRR